MPSFLSKVFGRKKDSSVDSRASTPLDGKFEPVSPSATTFPEAVNGKSESKDKDPSPLNLFKPKSRNQQPVHAQKRVHAPHLSLNFPTLNENAKLPSLGVVFEVDPETLEPLADSVISQRQLSPAESLSLIRTCSKAITERGLETLGVMHPHWHSASLESQRKLLTLFIHSLATSSDSSSSPSPTAYATAFQNEISSSRSPHDVAAVLRWGLRHLQLENNQFGKDDKWFINFSTKEREDDYPSNAFSVILPPQLPAAHTELLKTILELISYLAAHSGATGSSGSRISKFLGLWLLEAKQAWSDDNWDTFYARWERAGRILEQLFLARVRDEGTSVRLPTRLNELISKYPYGGSSPETGLIPRPLFSTYQHPALFVRVETEFTSRNPPKHHPFRLLADAFKCETTAEGHCIAVWESIKKTGADESEPSPGGYAGVGRVFAEETIRLLSLVPSTTTNAQNPFIRASSPSGRGRSFSLGDIEEPNPSSPVPFRSKSPAPASPTVPSKIQDWGDFMNSGFASEENEAANTSLASTLIKADLEPSRHLSKSRKSYEAPRGLRSMAEEIDEDSLISKSTAVHMIQLDEAFIDFWSDALPDTSLTSNWPGFVICKLKPTLPGLEVDGQRVEWLVIERQYKRPAPGPVGSEQTSSESTAARLRTRSSSPKSMRTDMNITTSLKRLSFLGGSFAGKSKPASIGKKAGYRTGEMGETLEEDGDENSGKKTAEEKSRSRTSLVIPKIKLPSPKSKKSVDFVREGAQKPAEQVEVATSAATTAAENASATNGHTVPAVEDQPIPVEQIDDVAPIEPPVAEQANGHQQTAAVPENAKRDVPIEVTQVLESSPHSEPLAVPDYTAGDNQVDLPAVPVVDAVPEFPMEEPETTSAVASVPAIVAPETDDAEPVVDTVIAHGDTPGPQALLDHVEEADATKAEEPEEAKLAQP